MRIASQRISRINKTAVPQGDEPMHTLTKSRRGATVWQQGGVPSSDDCLQLAEALKYGALMQVLTHLHVSVLPPLEQIETKSRG